jgi:hypothetical protein
VVEYKLSANVGIISVIGELYTTTKLSPFARTCAEYLGIIVHEEFPFDRNYPCIKCNISKDGSKIYHLPFDQQYDRVVINITKGECFVATVAEAEERGFRRAMRHKQIV